MLHQPLRDELHRHLQLYAKWIYEHYPEMRENPKSDMIDYIYRCMSDRLKTVVSKERFEHLFKVRLKHFTQEQKKG